jgi:two-component system response regulator DesR
VLRVIHAAADGTKVVDTHRLLSAAPVAARQREEERDLLERERLLTDREREVLDCLAEGLSTAEVAERLSISPRTVENHVQHIIRKLEVDSRLQTVVSAARMEGHDSEPLRETTYARHRLVAMPHPTRPPCGLSGRGLSLQHNVLYTPTPLMDQAIRGTGRPGVEEMEGNAKRGVGVLLVRSETPLFMGVLAKALAREPAVRLVSGPLPLDEALLFCRSHRPDVVLIEVTEATDASLLLLIRSITEACDGAPVILVADELIDDAFLVAGVEAGAFGILDATAGVEDVLRTVVAAASGRKIVDVDRFVNAVETRARTRREERAWIERGRRLTEREREVLRCLSEGLRNSEIAIRLSISPRTVDKHVEHILRKLDARSRLHAAALAARMEDLVYEGMRGTA